MGKRSLSMMGAGCWAWSLPGHVLGGFCKVPALLLWSFPQCQQACCRHTLVPHAPHPILLHPSFSQQPHHSWRVDMFQMVEKSNRWIPPPMTVGVVPAREKNQTAAQRGGAVGRGDHGDMPLSDLQVRGGVGRLGGEPRGWVGSLGAGWGPSAKQCGCWPLVAWAAAWVGICKPEAPGVSRPGAAAAVAHNLLPVLSLNPHCPPLSSHSVTSLRTCCGG